MSSALRHPLPGDASRATPEVRLSVEQVSYPTRRILRKLALHAGGDELSGQTRELVAILGPNAQRQIHASSNSSPVFARATFRPNFS